MLASLSRQLQFRVCTKMGMNSCFLKGGIMVPSIILKVGIRLMIGIRKYLILVEEPMWGILLF